MLVVVQNLDIDSQFLLQSPLYCIDRSISNTLESLFHAMIGVNHLDQSCIYAILHLGIGNLALPEMNWLLPIQVAASEFVHDLLRRNLALLLGNLLNHICKLLVHSLRKLEAIEGIHYKRYAALAGLTVDSNNRLVLSANIGRIDRKIWHLPIFSVSLVKGLHTLVDRILMRTGKCCKYQLSCIWMTGRDLHLGTPLINLSQLADIFHLKLGINSLGKHIISQCKNIDITGTLTVSKQSTLNSVRSG